MTTTRIACTCDTCKANATKIGAAFPLQADIPSRLASTVDKKGVHSLVYDAHSPSALGQAIRQQLGLIPVR